MKNQHRPWSPEDDQALRAGLAEGLTVREAADRLGRTYMATQVHISRFDMRAGRPSYCGEQRRRWARPTIAEIRGSVATHYGLDERELMSADRHRRVAWPRQTAMYLARRLTGRPFAVIARHLGGRHYSTIIWGCRKVEARMKTDTSQQIEVEHMARRIIREKHG